MSTGHKLAAKRASRLVFDNALKLVRVFNASGSTWCIVYHALTQWICAVSASRKAMLGWMILFSMSVSTGQPVLASEQFNDLQCKIEFIDKDICNVSFFRRFLSVRMLKSGSAERILYKDVVRWSYENASLRKRSGARVPLLDEINPVLGGLSSLLTTKVEHIHIFSIVYRDKDLGEYRTLVIDFDDISNVPPMKALLNDIMSESAPRS